MFPPRLPESSIYSGHEPNGPEVLIVDAEVMPVPERPHATPPSAEDGLAVAIVRTVRLPLLVLDEALAVVMANAAFLVDFGVEWSDVVGRPLFEAGAGRWELSREVEELRARLRRVSGTEAGELDGFELRASSSGGEDRVYLASGHRLESGPGGEARILVSLEDVTERDRLERQARTYARELERSNRELEDFAHAASHDLQEPLRKIRMYAERLPEMVDPSSLTERAARYLTRLGEAALRMQDRIDALLQLARVGRARPEPQLIDLNRVVGEVLEDVGVSAAESDAEIDIGHLGEMEADPVQIRLLFQNLLSNAIKFHAPESAPVIRVRAVDGDPAGEAAAEAARDRAGGWIGASAAVPWRTIVVEDEGVGFEQEYAERIFGPFQRLHGRAQYEGSGVGLSLCRRIVEHHWGSIRAEGRPGVGARFIITLPVGQPERDLA